MDVKLAGCSSEGRQAAMEEDSREMESRVAEPMSPSLIPPAEVDLLRTANHPRTPSLSGRPATSSMTFLIAPCNLASTETGISTHTRTPSLISFPLSSSPLFSCIPPLLSLSLSLLFLISLSRQGSSSSLPKRNQLGLGRWGRLYMWPHLHSV